MGRVDEISVSVDIDDLVAHHFERCDFNRVITAKILEIQKPPLAGIVFFEPIGKAVQVGDALAFCSSSQHMDMVSHNLVGEDGQSALCGTDCAV